MKNNPIPHYHIRTIRQLRRERERIGMHIELSEQKIRHDYRHMVDILTIANIAKLAVEHVQGLRDLFEMARESFYSIKGFFEERKEKRAQEKIEAGKPEALPAKSIRRTAAPRKKTPASAE